MASLDHVFDDALAGFDDDDDDDDELQFAPTAAAASSQQPTASSSQAQPAMQQRVAPHAPSDGGASTSAAASSSSTPQASTAAGSSKQGRMQFDPLKRNKGAGAGKKASSSRPALTPEVKHLQEDLAALMSEWSQAMHPEASAGAGPAAAGSQQQQQRSGASILQALQEQTQRTVDQQARARPPPAAAAGGGEDPQQMSMIVDVVMQHLLSKDVLYQPMKEIADKYPPWLERQAAAGSSSTLSPADLDRYRRQYDCITRLCAAYETEPGNTAKIMGLLQEMQACGEPPEDIVADMTNTIAADLPNLSGAGAGGAGALGDLNFEDLDLGGLGDVPDLKNCPMQ